jgi:hypothetical protein
MLYNPRYVRPTEKTYYLLGSGTDNTMMIIVSPVRRELSESMPKVHEFAQIHRCQAVRPKLELNWQ